MICRPSQMMGSEFMYIVDYNHHWKMNQSILTLILETRHKTLYFLYKRNKPPHPEITLIAMQSIKTSAKYIWTWKGSRFWKVIQPILCHCPLTIPSKNIRGYRKKLVVWDGLKVYLVNSFMTEDLIIQKPVHWFVLQINGLVSTW